MCLSLLLSSLLTLVQLNCENLFDCRHDSLKQDIEFTPEGDRRWTESKYWDKLDNTAKAIISCGTEDGDWRLPDIVALCEVENDSVMHDLTRRSLLRSANYEYIMTSSPDERGIDVALLYSPGSFAPIRYYPLRIKPMKGMRPTRDILYVAGRIITGDTVHIFVVHAPSRYGGERRTRPHRKLVADCLSAAIDSLHAVANDPMIIITGDFNEGGDGSMAVQMRAKGMADVSADATGSHGAQGTYKYKGRWERIDHIMASPQLARQLRSCRVCDEPFMLEEDDKYGGVQPLRTYRAWRYRRGFSDHLPLVARFVFE
jgi:endonuclease/exonuclease/phosphatase family metal-dependent hydrolase